MTDPEVATAGDDRIAAVRILAARLIANRRGPAPRSTLGLVADQLAELAPRVTALLATGAPGARDALAPSSGRRGRRLAALPAGADPRAAFPTSAHAPQAPGPGACAVRLSMGDTCIQGPSCAEPPDPQSVEPGLA